MDLKLYIGFFFVNCYPFLATTKNKVDFITAEPCIPRTTSYITKAIDTVLGLYEARGFNITSFHVYNEFKVNTFKAHLLPICTYIYGKEEHIGII